MGIISLDAKSPIFSRIVPLFAAIFGSNTMEIKITSFVNSCAPRDYSASRAEIGDDAGRVTWEAALEDSADNLDLLDSADKVEAFQAFVISSGGWSEAEVTAWNHQELTALFIQWISGDLREMGIDDTSDIDWEDVESGQHSGSYPGNIFRGTDGEIYFYAGS
jgi:GH18 family chitinase